MKKDEKDEKVNPDETIKQEANNPLVQPDNKAISQTMFAIRVRPDGAIEFTNSPALPIQRVCSMDEAIGYMYRLIGQIQNQRMADAVGQALAPLNKMFQDLPADISKVFYNEFRRMVDENKKKPVIEVPPGFKTN